MGIAAIIALCGLVAQPPDEASLKPYIVKLRGESEPLHILVDESTLSRGVSIEYWLDEPWLGPPDLQRLQRNEIEPDGILPEERAQRAARIRRGWLANDGVEVETRSGEKKWVLRKELEWAEKSRELARSSEPGETEVVPGALELPEGQSDPGPGALRLWGPHAAIAAGALALAAGVAALLLRRRAPWQALGSSGPAPRRR